MNMKLPVLTLLLALSLCTVVGAGTAWALSQTMGLIRNDPGTFDGYTLFSALTWPELYLIDMEGRQVHSWPTTFVTGNTAYLIEDGHGMRCADPGANPVFMAGVGLLLVGFAFRDDPSHRNNGRILLGYYCALALGILVGLGLNISDLGEPVEHRSWLPA